MAVRFDAAADDLNVAVALGQNHTLMGWFYLSIDKNDYNTFFSARNDFHVGTDADGTELALWDGSTFTESSFALPIATWFHLAWVRAGNSNLVYIDGTQRLSYSGANTDGTKVRIGNNEYSEFLNGRAAYVKAWSRNLSQAEVLNEMRTVRPQMVTNFVGWWPLLAGASERLSDYFGTLTLTAGGTLTDEDPPPIGWGGASTKIPPRPVSSGTDYTMPADAGSYVLTGAAAGLLYNRRLVAGVGAYTLTGQDVSFERIIPADAGVYTLTGQPVTFVYGKRLAADAGSYVLTGSNASLRMDRRLAAQSGAYVVTGIDVTFRYGVRLVADAGAYSLTGQAASLRLNRTLLALPGEYTFLGLSAGLEYNRRLVAGAGSYLLTGQDAELFKGLRLIAASGSYVLTGSVVQLTFFRRLVAEAGSYVITGRDVTFVFTAPGADTPLSPPFRLTIIDPKRTLRFV